ncbi:MAG TPA: superoxide dismutase family protein [Flavobacteriaceae bacterium]|nr:superoxide dismutase family protein [Flavobacteriaceae bacterium]
MKKVGIIFFTLALVAFTSCKDNKKESEDQDTPSMIEPGMDSDKSDMDIDDSAKKTKTVMMSSKSNSNVKGEVTFTEEDGVVKMEAKFSGLKPGTHAIHLHETADCSSDDGTSSGGHWNPTDERHGKWGDSDGYHKGDIGNFEADKDGNGTVTFETDEWCIGCDDDTKNIIGTAVVVHEGEDDFESQPAGDAGARVSCGEVK